MYIVYACMWLWAYLWRLEEGNKCPLLLFTLFFESGPLAEPVIVLPLPPGAGVTST